MAKTTPSPPAPSFSRDQIEYLERCYDHALPTEIDDLRDPVRIAYLAGQRSVAENERARYEVTLTKQGR